MRYEIRDKVIRDEKLYGYERRCYWIMENGIEILKNFEKLLLNLIKFVKI